MLRNFSNVTITVDGKNKLYSSHFREIFNVKYEIRTKEESEIRTGNISSIEISKQFLHINLRRDVVKRCCIFENDENDKEHRQTVNEEWKTMHKYTLGGKMLINKLQIIYICVFIISNKENFRFYNFLTNECAVRSCRRWKTVSRTID